MSGLGIGLAGNFFNQRIIQLWHLHELCPWPGQGRAKLGHKMPHTCLAACHAVGFKQAHLRPTQPKAIADNLVNLGCSCHIIFHQP